MTDMDTRNRLTEAAARRGLDFLVAQRARLEAAVVDHIWFGGDPEAVIAALATFQNADGGFGKGLEVDIGAPESNPFAMRLALIHLRTVPPTVGEDLRARAGVWLAENQASDGDWHFSEEARSGELAPWFEGWTFPSLNPACCLAGQAVAVEVATPTMLERVDLLFREQASVNAVRDGDFYALLPYVEYSLTGALPTEYVEAVGETINEWARRELFDDAEHFFNLAFGGSPEVTDRIPADVVETYADRALAEQLDDGGWPTAYDAAWRPAATAAVLVALSKLLG